MASKPETLITNKCIAYLKKNRGDAFHVHGSMFQRSGEPDISGEIYAPELSYWLHLKIEVKTDKGVPTELQKQRLRDYGKRGYVVGVVTSVAELEKIIMAYTRYRLKAQGTILTYLKELGIQDEYAIYS